MDNSYYSNLLIMQYHNKPKAKATIEATVGLLPDDLIMEVINGFDIETAVGKQLDILGEYVGVDRYYLVDNQAELLDDEDYRILIKMKAISNTSDLSHKSLEEALYNFFGNTVRMDSDGNMEMTYFVPKNKTPIIQAAIQKEVLPRPMGVRCSYIIEYDKRFFGFCTYQNQTAVYKTGFRTYNNPNKVGEVLTYSKRIEF
jgi:hypothetical protein